MGVLNLFGFCCAACRRTGQGIYPHYLYSHLCDECGEHEHQRKRREHKKQQQEDNDETE